MKASELRRTESYLEKPLYDFNQAYKLGINKLMQLINQVNQVYRYYEMKRKNIGNPNFKLDPRIEDEEEEKQDILFFLHGKKDVNKTVKMLNEMIPDPRFIALPIYSGVHPVFMMMMDAKPGYVS